MRRVVFCWVLLLGLAMGCEESKRCEGDATCAGGQVCKDGACVAGCREASDCKAGEQCFAGKCKAESCQPGAERDCFEAAPGTPGKGACEKGRQFCTQEGKWSACAGQQLPQDETCDKIDNDCDGSIDEGLDCQCKPGAVQKCYGGPAGSRGVGPCVEGEQTCESDNLWGPCREQVLPSLEQCDGIDNDCDGNIDEELPSCQRKEQITAAGSAEFDTANDVVVDAAGNIYVTGSVGIPKIRFGEKELEPKGRNNLFVAKLDQGGKWIWVALAEGQSDAVGSSIALNGKGELLVTGFFTGSISLGSMTLQAQKRDIFVARLDPMGKWLWAVKAGSNENDQGRDLVVDQGGDIFVTGYFQNELSLGSKLLKARGDRDVFVARLSNEGQWKWAASMGSDGRDEGHGLALSPQGQVVVTGFFEGKSLSTGAITAGSKGERDAFVAQLDAKGQWMWLQTAGSSKFDQGASVVVTTSGEIIHSGEFGGPIAFGPHKLDPKNASDVFVAKMDSKGKWLWAARVGARTGGFVQARGLALTSSKQILLAGHFRGAIDLGADTPLTSKGNTWDVFAARLSPMGTWLWRKSTGSTSDDYAQNMALGPQQLPHVVGHFSGPDAFGKDSPKHVGNGDLFVWKINP